jgi:hypothetical protein
MTSTIRLVMVFLLLFSAGGCSWFTQSSARQQRIDDCLARCERDHGRPPQRSSRELDAPGYGLRDSRSECERACHAIK